MRESCKFSCCSVSCEVSVIVLYPSGFILKESTLDAACNGINQLLLHMCIYALSNCLLGRI